MHLTPSALGWPSRPSPAATAGPHRRRAASTWRPSTPGGSCSTWPTPAAAFWDALAVHEPAVPAIVSHTGVRGVHDVWRNVDDDQIRAIAATGGVVGIMFHSGFLGERRPRPSSATWSHVIDVGGEDCAALGSDWDGFIVTPRDMPTVRSCRSCWPGHAGPRLLRGAGGQDRRRQLPAGGRVRRG